MESSAFMIFLFLKLSLFSKGVAIFKVDVVIPSNRVPLKVSCSSNTAIDIVDTATIICANDFWAKRSHVDITGNISASAQVVVFKDNGQEKYRAYFVKSFHFARFYYTTNGTTRWEIQVKTSNQSNNIVGRVYVTMDCTTNARVSLAESFDNFTPGKTDTFTLMAPDITKDHFCFSIWETLNENWHLTSVKLYNLDTQKTHMFEHGESLISQRYNRYQGPQSYEWEVTVETGDKGTDVGVDISLEGTSCKTLLTLDDADDNFMVNSTDVFTVVAQSCGQLTSVQLSCQRKCDWIMKTLTVSSPSKPEFTYPILHGENVVKEQTFFTNQSKGLNEWNVHACTRTSTDEGVFLTLHGNSGEEGHLRLTTAEDDFQANTCGNFTLPFGDIGDLQYILVDFPEGLEINRLLISNKTHIYQYHLLGRRATDFKMIVYRTNFLSHKLKPKYNNIDLGDTFKVIGIKVKTPTSLGTKVGSPWKICFNEQFVSDYLKCKQPISGQKVKVYTDKGYGSIELDVRPKQGKTIWFLDIQFSGNVSHAYVQLEDSKLRSFLTYSSEMTEMISTYFYTDDQLFKDLSLLSLIIEPSDYPCNDIKMQLLKVNSDEVLRGYQRTTSTKCTWIFYEFKIETTTETATTTPVTNTWSTTNENTPSTFDWSPLSNSPTLTEIGQTTNTESTISTLATDTESTNSKLPKTGPTIYLSNAVESSTVPYSNPSLTNDSTTNSPNNTDAKNRTMCKCICPRVLSKKEEAEKMKELVKELKVNRNETNSYFRSKTSAPDERTSSKVIGSTIVIIMGVPFGMILLIDLIPLFNLIYKKVVSLM